VKIKYTARINILKTQENRITKINVTGLKGNKLGKNSKQI
jgi:hypothetical protein